MPLLDSLKRRMKRFWYNFEWSEWVSFIDGWIPRFAFFVPIIGYLILFNDHVGGKLAFTNLVGSEFQNFWLSGGFRLRLVYFGLIALGLSNLIYRLRKPYVFRFGTNRTDYTRTCLDAFTFQDFLNIHHTIGSKGHLTLDGKYYDSEWDGFARAARNEGEGTDHVMRSGNWEEARRQYGSLLRSMLGEYFFRSNIVRRSWLITCIVLSTAGYALLAIPSVDLFVKVFLSTIGLQLVR